MDGPALDNANPTILSAAQLPSRRQQRFHGSSSSGQGPEARFDDILSLRHLGAPLDLSVSSWPSSDEDGAGDSDFAEEPIDQQEIYDLISTISDPEHPHTLGQLSVVNLPDIQISTPAVPSPSSPSSPSSSALSRVLVDLTPTINHCSLATVIGLAVRVRLEAALPPSYRVDVRIKAGSHDQDDQVNKQLSDKERVAAALENDTLRGVLDKMLETCR